MPKPLALRTSPILGLLGLLAVGCSRPRVSSPPAPPTSSASFPVTLTDAQDQSVTLPRKPARIVSIAPTVTEMLFAIGAGKQVVGVTEQCDYPAEVKALPRVGQWWQPSAERIVGAKPDLVVAQRGNTLETVMALRKSGLKVFTIAPRTIEEIYTTLQQLGRLTGNAEGAGRVISTMRGRMKVIGAKIAAVPESKRPTAFIIVQVSPVWTAGAGTFQDEAIRAAGARNLGASVQDFREFSLEKLVAADPDFLLVTTMRGTPDQMKRDVLASPALSRLTAVRQRRLLLLNADEIDRPGPRLVNAIETMARGFHPGRFEEAGRRGG